MRFARFRAQAVAHLPTARIGNRSPEGLSEAYRANQGWKSQRGTTRRRAYSTSSFLRLCEQYHNLEIWCNEHATVTLPQAKGEASRFGYGDAEELAKRVDGTCS